MPIASHSVSLAFARGGDVVGWQASLSAAEADRLAGLFDGLARLGHIAAWQVEPGEGVGGSADLVERLKGRLGELVVDAVLAAPCGGHEPRPAFLIPAWPFDHLIGGKPASTARFLSLDLELLAELSLDEEVGIILPGHAGRWLISARPFGT